ncbi:MULTISPECIES: hypothetical protein [Mycobacterium]|nr:MULTISPECIES: hypothetical protein [Mycobacterium]
MDALAVAMIDAPVIGGSGAVCWLSAHAAEHRDEREPVWVTVRPD